MTMNKFSIACLVGLAAVTISTMPTIASEIGSKSMYCRNQSYDPICMSPKMFKMRMAMMAMSMQKVTENRSKYCRDHGATSDPICAPAMMHSKMGF